MKLDALLAACEAVVFASGEPVHIDRVREALGISRADAEKLLQVIQEGYDRRGSGVQLVRLDDCWQFCTRSSCQDYVKKAYEIKRNAPLSQAALEVLAVIAYNQPVTRAFVEQVRGVDCSGVVGTLCEKGLIEERGRLELPGRPLLYGTTPVFLRSFGIASLEELPPLPEELHSQSPEEQTVMEPAAGEISADERESVDAKEPAAQGDPAADKAPMDHPGIGR